MRVLVTGAAGFIGSHLSRRLSQSGHDLWGIDSFEPYYDRVLKQRNCTFAGASQDWRFEERAIRSLSAADLDECDVVVHLAAQPGVRDSWDQFDRYARLNLVETNHLAAVAKEAGVNRVVFASSSSVYGNADRYPTRETDPLLPRSPYGVTKQAGESLWRAYTSSSDLTVIALRLFTVYGPGQRPDMAIQRLIDAALSGSAFPLYGDGAQRRDFTFIGDVVDAVVKACEAALPSGFHPVNIGAAGDTSMVDLVAMVEKETGRRIRLERLPAQRGDADRTGADVSVARDLLGWAPRTVVADGLARQVAFARDPRPETWSAALISPQ